MSPNSNTVEHAPIAGEPAHDQTSPSVPPFSEQNRSTEIQSGTRQSVVENGRYQGVLARNRPSRKSKILIAIQVLSIVVALILSSYALVVLNGLQLSQGKDGQDGIETLVISEGREADMICTEGGSDIFIGTDNNQNGILDEIEISSTTKICHGKEGLSGPQGANGDSGGLGDNGTSSLVRIITIYVGNATCPEGGIAIYSGIDVNQNDFLDDEEFATVNELCDGKIGGDGNTGGNGSNGGNGAPALVKKEIPPSNICPVGFILRFGIDDGTGDSTAFDGNLSDDEVDEELKVCSTPLTAERISDTSPNSNDGITPSCNAMNWNEEYSITLFAAYSPFDGCELWITEGITDTTTMLLDINPLGDSLPGNALGFTSVVGQQGELIFFDADDGTNGRELWVTDGTTIGTHIVQNIFAQNSIDANSVLVPFMQGVVFTTSSNTIHWANSSDIVELSQIPMFDNTTQSILNSIFSTLSPDAFSLLDSDAENLWFIAKDSNGDLEPHQLSTSGQLTSYDVNPNGNSLAQFGISTEQGLVVVASANSGRQLALLSSGNVTWLTSLMDTINGNWPIDVGTGLGLHSLSTKIIFDAQTSGVNPTLWAYDFNNGMTTSLSTEIVIPGERTEAVVNGGKIFFDCVTATYGSELCSSDGTIDGTVVITDLSSGVVDSNVRHISAIGDNIIFIASADDIGFALWSLDSSGTIQMQYDPYQGAGNDSDSGQYGNMIITETQVIFVARDGQNGNELYAWTHLQLTDEWLIW
jgi:ELWxxDGT repeat protein